MNELLTVPPVQIGAWLACLAFTVMLANGLVKLWASVRGKPAPGELSERTSANSSSPKTKSCTSGSTASRRIFIRCWARLTRCSRKE